MDIGTWPMAICQSLCTNPEIAIVQYSIWLFGSCFSTGIINPGMLPARKRLFDGMAEDHLRGRRRLGNYSLAYLNSGSILRPSFVPPGSTNFLSTNFRLS